VQDYRTANDFVFEIDVELGFVRFGSRIGVRCGALTGVRAADEVTK
jgi:hypothetical protein